LPQVNQNNTQSFWRSVEHLENSPEFRETAQQEFPGNASEQESFLSVSRRRFLQFMGGTLALAGVTLTGCRRWPEEKLAPFANNQTGRIPGEPERFSSSFDLGGVAQPLLITSFEGRPIKVEGNPGHPLSLGASSMFAQASLLDMYDPERLNFYKHRETPTGATMNSSKEAFTKALGKLIAQHKSIGGKGLVIISEAFSGPTALRLRAKIAKELPQAVYFEYEPVSRDNQAQGLKLAYGSVLRPLYNLKKAQVIATFDDCLLSGHPDSLSHARDWAANRKTVDDEGQKMSRVYAIESTYTTTGTTADARLPLGPSQIALAVHALASKLSVAGAKAGALDGAAEKFISALAKDLKNNSGSALVTLGSGYSPDLHALVAGINDALLAQGKTVSYVPEPEQREKGHNQAIIDATALIGSGQATTVVILGGNPAYDAPADLGFAGALAKANTVVHVTHYINETSVLAHWVAPKAHYLEAWGDGYAWDLSVTSVQPIILPLYDGLSGIEVLSLILGEGKEGYELVRGTFAASAGIAAELPGFEKAWRKFIHDGFLAGSAAKTTVPAAVIKGFETTAPQKPSDFELTFITDRCVFDGRFANNAWLQELPDPLTKVVWDNALLINKKDADSLGLTTGDLARVSAGGKDLEVAVYVLMGQPKGVVTLPLGYGRDVCGSVGQAVGFNAYKLRTSKTTFAASGVKIANVGRKYRLVTTVNHHILDEIGVIARDVRVGAKAGQSGLIIKDANVADFKKDPKFVNKDIHGNISLQLFDTPSDYTDKNHAWGMAVDMSSCLGCSACVVACYAENNIPAVGKEEVDNNREMAWLRIDRYFKGDPDADEAPAVVYQPMMCQQCENAPCEQVCPVGATMHDTEGLNVMVYNRCIGTRYCSNNCPYKVRRFNYFDYHSRSPRQEAAVVLHVQVGNQGNTWLGIPDEQQKYSVDKIKSMVFNPEVTVRMRGLMEKCTYCIQRIHTIKTDKRVKGEKLADGDIQTACQQSCPTSAIVFGDLKDPQSRVSKLQKLNRSYGVLAELNTKPRTQYLAKIRNPNPELA
jgi:MoCo/4Fe-4S cofactor protein with predicted Tat translocation signal